MSADNHGGPAFPTGTQAAQNAATGETTLHQYLSDGMTMRDYFAAKAMQGQVSNGRWGHEIIARDAYAIADAMLEARSNGGAS